MEWLVLIIPFIFSILGLLFFKHKITRLELLIPIITSIILISSFKACSTSSNIKDYEYWGGKILSANYIEKWNEYIKKECSYTCCCDDEGDNCDTNYYDCSYVKNHPEEWYIIDENSEYHNITKSEYYRLVNLFNNENFIDMKRDFHTIDGDKYTSYWDKRYETIENITTIRKYKNKVQATKNLFHYEDLAPDDINDLYEYPPIENLKQEHLLGYEHKLASKELERINGLIAKNKEIKIFVLVYDNPDRNISYKQETFWKGGNKNEFVLTLGVQNNIIVWSRVISWTENQYSKILIEDLFMDNTDMGCLDTTVKNMIPILNKDFKRKKFTDFDYLKIPMSNTQIIWLYIIAIVINIIILIIITNNEFDDNRTF